MSVMPAVGEIDQEVGGLIVKVTGDWIVAVVPMIYNDRVLLLHKDGWDTGWEAGYCYDKGLPALAAASVWDPEAQRHPVGYKKIAGETYLARCRTLKGSG